MIIIIIVIIIIIIINKTTCNHVSYYTQMQKKVCTLVDFLKMQEWNIIMCGITFSIFNVFLTNMIMLLFGISLKHGASMCSSDQNKKIQIDNNSRVRSKLEVNNLHDLRNALQVDWNNISAHVSQRYANSMRRRILDVI